MRQLSNAAKEALSGVTLGSKQELPALLTSHLPRVGVADMEQAMLVRPIWLCVQTPCIQVLALQRY